MIKKWKNGAKKSQMSWNPKNAKNLEFFHFFIMFFHFWVMFSESLDFAECSSRFPDFLVEHVAKHKKSMEKAQKMMRNE